MKLLKNELEVVAYALIDCITEYENKKPQVRRYFSTTQFNRLLKETDKLGKMLEEILKMEST